MNAHILLNVVNADRVLKINILGLCMKLFKREVTEPQTVKPPSNANDDINAEGRDLSVLKINSVENRVVLMRISAVKIVNPATGKSFLAYAQHDTASLATLISETLKAELGLQATSDLLRTLANEKVSSEGRTNFKLESLYSGEQFHINGAVVVPEFLDDENTLPHAVDTSTLEHFQGVQIPVVPDRRRVDVLIGQCDKTLLTVLEERESIDPEEPNYVLTRLGPIAGGGRIGLMSKFSDALSTFRINVDSPVSNPVCDNSKLREENSALKQLIREYELMDETVQPSKNDERVFELAELKIAIKDGRYQIPVPLKSKEVL